MVRVMVFYLLVVIPVVEILPKVMGCQMAIVFMLAMGNISLRRYRQTSGWYDPTLTVCTHDKLDVPLTSITDTNLLVNSWNCICVFAELV